MVQDVEEPIGVVDSHVAKVGDIKHVVPAQRIGADDAVGYDLALQDWLERGGSSRLELILA